MQRQPSLQVAMNLGVTFRGLCSKPFPTSSSCAYLDLPSQRQDHFFGAQDPQGINGLLRRTWPVSTDALSMGSKHFDFIATKVSQDKRNIPHHTVSGWLAEISYTLREPPLYMLLCTQGILTFLVPWRLLSSPTKPQESLSPLA